MLNTASDFICVCACLSGCTHTEAISAVPAPTSLLSQVILPDKLGLVERGKRAPCTGSFAFSPWFPFPGKAGRAAGRCVKESQRKRFFPEGAIQLSHCRCKNTSKPPERSEPSMLRHVKPATIRPFLPPRRQPGMLHPPPTKSVTKSISQLSSRGLAVQTPTQCGFQPRASPLPMQRGPSSNKLLPNACLWGAGRKGSPVLYLGLLITKEGSSST